MAYFMEKKEWEPTMVSIVKRPKHSIQGCGLQ